MNGILLIMSDEQRALFARMQALMTLLEGHADVRDERGGKRARGRSRPDAERPARPVERSRGGVEKVFQQAIGFESKVQQYASGERFVREVVAGAGMEGFNRVWQDEANLPTSRRYADPARWVGRVAKG